MEERHTRRTRRSAHERMEERHTQRTRRSACSATPTSSSSVMAAAATASSGNRDRLHEDRRRSISSGCTCPRLAHRSCTPSYSTRARVASRVKRTRRANSGTMPSSVPHAPLHSPPLQPPPPPHHHRPPPPRPPPRAAKPTAVRWASHHGSGGKAAAPTTRRSAGRMDTPPTKVALTATRAARGRAAASGGLLRV